MVILYFFIFFLRDILLRMGKTAAISNYSTSGILPFPRGFFFVLTFETVDITLSSGLLVAEQSSDFAIVPLKL